MHALSTSFILGYHGCDKSVGEAILSGVPFKPSKNEYDWLGHGIYFWEANPQRALEYARETKARKMKTGGSGSPFEPFVIGAVINLGLCLDLTTAIGIAQVKSAYRGLTQALAQTGDPVPSNGTSGLLRPLDCAVINFLHDVRKDSLAPAIDAIKGVFTEGDRLYDTSGFYEKTHIQICVRNPDAIKGVFRVPDSELAVMRR